ncbi:MAG: T9SS type A sorting domain-containing protein, partial [Ignavibacteria bacterium]|nr:T9SS type A sorting domain-containing protein [Ignavibacteria bacterium]
VYDVLGNKVATLVDEQKYSGNYEVEFNASSLASGIYLYTLIAGSYTETKKMILLR